MDSNEMKDNLNVTELLIQISRDVASIKTDMVNFKETQKSEKENTAREIADIRADFKRDITDLETRVFSKIGNMQSVQNNLVGDVDTLKHADEKKDAKRWRTVMAYIATAVGGMILAKLPDLCITLLNTAGGK